MNVFTGSQAKFMFKDDDIPLNSIGVFQPYGRTHWVYWFSDSHTFDVGEAEKEEEALKKAKSNIK